MSEYAVVEALGVRVYEVPDLMEESVFCPKSGALFVRAGMDPEEQRANAEWAVSEALDEMVGVAR